MAPEILRKFPEQRESRPGDVYAFGIILYEVCSRMKPYISEVWYQTVGGKCFYSQLIYEP